MAEPLTTWLLIAMGALFVICRKHVARSNEAFHRFMMPDAEPFNPDVMQGWEIVIAILGTLTVVLGVLLLLDVLPAPS